MFKIFSGIALCSALLLVSCSKKTEEKEADPVYSVTSPLKKDTILTKEYVAQIKSVKNIEIRAQEKGFLQKVFVDEGQYVRQGQVLFQIMPQLYQADYMKAKAEAAQAKIELQNANTLSSNNVVSPQERAMAKAKLDAAAAEVKSAQIHLSFTSIRAPFSGIINRLPLKLGSLVNEGDLLTTLSDNSGIFAYFNVAEPEYISYMMHSSENQKTPVSLMMANGEKFPEQGYVQTVEGEFDNETGNIAFRAKFPNSKNILRNNQTGKIQMAVPLTGAVIIPQKATYEIQDKTFVFVVDKMGVAKSREVKIGNELPDIYIVSSGLTEHDQILLDGVQKVKDDQKLKVKYENPSAVLKNLQYKAN